MKVVAETLNFQAGNINLTVCQTDIPINNADPTSFVPTVVALNLITRTIDGLLEGDYLRGFQTSVENRQVDVVQSNVQTAVEQTCKSSGSWADRQNQCCSGRYSVQGLIPGIPGPCA